MPVNHALKMSGLLDQLHTFRITIARIADPSRSTIQNTVVMRTAKIAVFGSDEVSDRDSTIFVPKVLHEVLNVRLADTRVAIFIEGQVFFIICQCNEICRRCEVRFMKESLSPFTAAINTTCKTLATRDKYTFIRMFEGVRDRSNTLK